MRQTRLASIALLTCLVPAAAAAQAPAPKNPTVVEWTCPDHDQDDQHELRILRVEGTNKVIITTILLGDPDYADAATRLVRSELNVQPIAFGEYVATLTASATVAGVTATSDPSAESNVFIRAPGPPSRPIIR